MGRAFSQTQREFIVLIAPVARAGDVASALGRPQAASIRRVLREAGRKGRSKTVQPLAKEAVHEAFRRFRSGGMDLSPNLLYWSQESGSRFANQKLLWTAGDDEVLRELVGRESIALLARRLRRSKYAIKSRMWLLGIRHKAVEFTCGEIARRLHIRQATVNQWCHDGKLRSWREGAWRIVHADDAEWLIENYRYRETDWNSLHKEVE